MKVGYARVSSFDQNLDVQINTLREYGCEKIFQEKVSAISTSGRDGLKECLNFVRADDELVITRIDRLARSILDLQLIIKDLSEKKVTLSATEQPISTKDATSKCFLDMLGVFAELETNLRKERQKEGIERAKARGVYQGRKGRQSRIDVEQIKTLKQSGLGATAIAKKMGIKRDNVYRLLRSDAVKRMESNERNAIPEMK